MKKGLNKEIIIAEIEKRKSDLKNKGVKKIGLFGSYLKGEQKRGSDIDFLVEFDEIKADNYFGLIFYLERLFRRKIDLVIEEDLKSSIKYVKKEARYVKI